jgi:hypothetical protein
MPNLNEVWKYDADNLVWNVSASVSGDVFAAGSWDSNIHLLDRKGTPVWKYKTGDFVASVAVSSDGEIVVGGSYDKHLYALGRAGKLIFKFKADSYVRGAGVSPSGNRIVAATWSGAVFGLDRKGQQQWKADVGANPLSVAVAGEGGQTVVGCADSTIRLLDGSGKEAWKFETGSAVLSVAASARGEFFAAGSTDTHIYLLDGMGKLLWKYRTGGVVRGVALSESGEYVLATSHDRYLYFFERSGKLLWISKVAPEVWTLGSSGMCDSIVLGCRDNSVRMLENNDIVKVQIEAARYAIQRAEEEGADAGEAQRLLRQSEDSSGAGNVQEALASAGKAKASAESVLGARLAGLITAKLAEFDRMAAELKEKGKSASRVEWASQRAKKLMEAKRLKKALESARRSEAYLKGLPAEEPKPLIPEEVSVAPEPAASAADDELRPAAELEYNNAMAEVAELEKSGADVSEAVALLEKASGAIGRKDYFVAAEFISSASKQAQSINKRRTEAAAKIAVSESAVAEAKGAGVDTGSLENTLKMAHDAMEAGEFDLAMDYAGQALGRMKEAREKAAPPGGAKAPAPAPRTEGAPKCPNCGKKVKAQWKSCPFCRTRLK